MYQNIYFRWLNTSNHLNCGKYLTLCERGSTRTGRSKSSKLKVVVGIFGGAVTLLAIGVLFLLCWQRMSYQPEIYIGIYGKNDHGLEFGQKRPFSWRQLLQTKINSINEQNILGKDGVGKRDVEVITTRRELDQYSVTRSQDTNAMPRCLNIQLLIEITKGFSKEHKIGHGAFGEVYMGELSDGEKIAVKKLRQHFIQVDDVHFNNELHILMKIQHPNIVKFVSYCYAIRHESVEINGKFVLAEIHERALCFEYLQNGSLKKHLTEVSRGLDWQTRYKIIKGICEGLNYLHNGSSDGNPIYHLDLKPDSILLDENMMPKIADFGLSRLFGTTHSHITKNFIGTRGYMPPEYVDVLKISNKYDIFSLGAVIIDIMTGPSSCRFDYAEISSSQDFVNLVQENWKRRLQATPSYISLEADCLKVKTCIEIAFKCMHTEREKRPTIALVLDTLNFIDTVERSSVVDQARLLKFGLWGGDGGRRQDINTEPHRLKSVTIYSSNVIHALEFSYTDRNGQYHTAGRWGSEGTSANKVQLHPSEFLVELWGTVGPFDGIPSVITSLTLVTNASKYGPFGQGDDGTSFHIIVQSSGHIAGFFVRADQYINSVGVYTNQEDAGQLAKIGPWGGDGGKPLDIKVVPHRLQTLMIRSADVIDSVAFSYSDRNGQPHTAGPWGGRGGEYHEIELDTAEFLVKVSGTSGPFNGIQKLITSLTFVTSAGRSYGPFGKQHGTPFDIPVHSKGCIVGFFVCAGTYLDAIGIYARPI